MEVDDRLNPNSVDIQLNENCDLCLCCATGFETNYPPELRDYISPYEFEQSITNINNKYPRWFYPCLCLVAILCIIAIAFAVVGIILLNGGIQQPKQHGMEYIIVGSVCILLGLCFCGICCRCFLTQISSTDPMLETIGEESKKYENRHCQWRLIAKRDEPTVCQGRNRPKKFHLIIDINQPQTH